MGHHAIGPDFFQVTTAEWPSSAPVGTLSLYLQNDGKADLTRAKLFITCESQYHILPDKTFEVVSQNLERSGHIQRISMDIPLIRPAPAEPFRFNLKIININTPSLMLSFKVEADQIPEGLELTALEVRQGKTPEAPK
jgi:hypothetical protein